MEGHGRFEPYEKAELRSCCCSLIASVTVETDVEKARKRHMKSTASASHTLTCRQAPRHGTRRSARRERRVRDVTRRRRALCSVYVVRTMTLRTRMALTTSADAEGWRIETTSWSTLSTGWASLPGAHRLVQHHAAHARRHTHAALRV